MASEHESTMKWKVDISQLKAGMQDAKRSISLANAEFKNATAGMSDWAKSVEGVEAKIKQLNSVSESQKTVLAALKDQYAIIAQELGEASPQAEKLRIQIENQEAAVKKTESELAGYNDRLATLKQDAAEAESPMGQLTRTIEEQEEQLADLKDQYAKAVLEYGKNSEEAQRLAGEIDDLSGELKENKDRLADTEYKAEDLDESLEEVTDSAKDAGEGFTVMKGALADLVSAGIQKAIEGLKELAHTAYESWQSWDSGADTIIAATGATGEAADRLMASYENVARTVQGDFGTIGTAIGEVNTRFGLMGDELESVSTKFLKFAQLNGVDVKTAIDNTQAAMAAFGLGVEDTANMIDILNKAGQDTGVSVDRLAADMAANAPVLQQMGMNAAEAAMFIANLGKSGIDASATMAGLKKALANAAAEGTPMATALSEIENSIKGAKTETEAISIATELFGSKAGAAIATAVRDGKLSFQDLGLTLNEFQGNVETTFDAIQDAPDKIGLALQNLKVDLAGLVGDLMERYAPQIEQMLNTFTTTILPQIQTGIQWFLDHLPQIGTLLQAIIAGFAAFKIVTLIQSIVTAFTAWQAATQGLTLAQQLLNAVMAANPIGLIATAIGLVVTAIVLLWNKSEAFREFWIGLWNSVQQVATAAWQVITQVFSAAWEAIKIIWQPAVEYFTMIWNNIKLVFSAVQSVLAGDFSGAWNAIKGIWDNVVGYFTNIWNRIKTLFSPVASFFKEKFSAAWEAVKNIFAPVGQFFAGIWDTIKQKFSDIGMKVGEAVGSAFKNAVNAVMKTVENVVNAPIDAINSLLGKINGIPGINLEPLNRFNLPRMAKGGVLDDGARAVIAGEDGAEAIVPLERNTAWIRRVADELRAAMFSDVSGLVSAIDTLTGTVTAAASGGIAPAQASRTMTFNQYNYSPKAVDRLTLYRQTSSLLFSANARMQNV